MLQITKVYGVRFLCVYGVLCMCVEKKRRKRTNEKKTTQMNSKRAHNGRKVESSIESEAACMCRIEWGSGRGSDGRGEVSNQERLNRDKGKSGR